MILFPATLSRTFRHRFLFCFCVVFFSFVTIDSHEPPDVACTYPPQKVLAMLMSLFSFMIRRNLSALKLECMWSRG